MSSRISVPRLLAQARALAGVGSGPGKPSPTDHRRAVSTAYYALFHEFNACIAAHVLDTAASDEDRAKVVRWTSHQGIKTACSQVSACAAVSGSAHAPSKNKTGYKDGVWHLFSVPDTGGGRVAAVPPPVASITDAVVNLQNARHLADYDPLARFSKAGVLAYIEEAKEAVDALAGNRDDPFAKKLFALSLARGRLHQH